jgi:chromosome segregation ATPase
MSKKLSLEIKIRDAAISLAKVNASHKKVAKQSDEQLEAANRRVDAAQKETWRVSERANEVHKKLLEHRAGVLSISVRSMEKKMATSTADTDGSGYNIANRSSMSPTASSMTSVSTSSKSRFDGAHLYAGHADALIPTLRRTLGAAEVAALEEKLKTVSDALCDATKKQAEMSRELSHLRLEKQEVETMMGMDLQSAEETISALEKELPRLESLDTQLRGLLNEKTVWDKDRAHLIERMRQMEEDLRLESLEKRNDEVAGIKGLLEAERESYRVELERKTAEVQTLTMEWDANRRAWERDKTAYECEMEQKIEASRREDAIALQMANAEVDNGLSALRTLVQNHGIVLFSRDSSLKGLLSSVGTHLEGIAAKADMHARAQAEWESVRRKLEEDVRSGLDKREALALHLEEARREREEARREVRSRETLVTVGSFTYIISSCIEIDFARTTPLKFRAPSHHQYLQWIWEGM